MMALSPQGQHASLACWRLEQTMPSSSPQFSFLEFKDQYRLIPLRNSQPNVPSQSRGPSNLQIVSPKRSNHSTIQSGSAKSTFLLQIGAFIVVELGFIALASVALRNPSALPVHLSLSLSLTEAKGALTVISVVWHSVAIFAVRNCPPSYFQRGMDGAGPKKREIIHFSSRDASLPFRRYHRKLNFKKGANANWNGQPHCYPNLQLNDEALLVPDRANLITRLEQLEDSIYGFRATQPNLLIPWPSSDLISNNQTIRYQSDVITYNFTCSWNVPTIDTSTGFLGVQGKNWSIFLQGLGVLDLPSLLDASEHVLVPSVLLPLIPSSFSDPTSRNGLCNTTLSNIVAMNLEGVPTTLSSGRFTSDGSSGNTTEDLLITTLICDPQLEISPATVTLQSGSLWADVHSGSPNVNNIPPEAANAVFSQSLLFATSTREAYGDQSLVNNIARLLFLTDPSFDYETAPAGIKPLSVDGISRQMDRVLLSSAKAYLSGYRPDSSNLTFPSFKMMNSSAEGEIQELVVAGSKPFLIALIVVVVVLIVLLIFLVSVVRTSQLQTFDLENIVKTLRID
ncbi:hypothetical protein NP233_g11162 [Leucocoprinus birnbaumii]|uniref:Uncharacterized protein n=1 Tax=Leucocoprinus birnbaumii TaxID=56174 RepID=A0AAD5VHX8_9AGAR|nr:hypothetical protein NP233_g11162 [Leucocoprinus birnbaumii]